MRKRDLMVIKTNQVTIERLKKIVINAVKEQTADVIDLQKEQLSAGILDMGDEIKPPYRPKTIEKKRKKGQPTDRVTLYDKGAFYRNIYAKFSDVIEISSRNQKAAKLKAKYDGGQFGGDIFGLTPGNKEFLKEIIRPLIEDAIRDLVIKKP